MPKGDRLKLKTDSGESTEPTYDDIIEGIIKKAKELPPSQPSLDELRRSYQYQRWHNLVLRTNHFCCAQCGLNPSQEEGSILHVHHIKSFALYPKVRFDPANGIILCKECHKELHRKRRDV